MRLLINICHFFNCNDCNLFLVLNFYLYTYLKLKLIFSLSVHNFGNVACLFPNLLFVCRWLAQEEDRFNAVVYEADTTLTA